MSIREITGRLTDAKNQVTQATAAGGQCAKTIAEAASLVRKVLDGVEDKTLADGIAERSKAVGDEFTAVASVNAGIDKAIRNYQAIGTGR
jgi:bacterioferritin-associated ferredoxin